MPSGALFSSRATSCLCIESFDAVDLPQEGLLPRVVICPSCQSKGSIPDDAQPARIRCPKCKQVFDTGGASQSSAGPANPPPVTVVPLGGPIPGDPPPEMATIVSLPGDELDQTA